MVLVLFLFIFLRRSIFVASVSLILLVLRFVVPNSSLSVCGVTRPPSFSLFVFRSPLLSVFPSGSISPLFGYYSLLRHLVDPLQGTIGPLGVSGWVWGWDLGRMGGVRRRGSARPQRLRCHYWQFSSRVVHTRSPIKIPRPLFFPAIFLGARRI